MDEIWKQIPDKFGYEVSDQGGARRWLSSRNRWRYFLVKPGEYGRIAGEHLHRQIYRTFVGPIPEGMVVRHLNDVKHDNRLVNIALGTYADNSQDMLRNNPGYASKMSTAIKAAYERPEFKAKQIAASKAATSRPEYKAKMSESIKAAYERPEFKAKLSQSLTKLTAEQVNEILAEFDTNPVRKFARYAEIGAKYGVSNRMIYNIIKGKYVPKDAK